MISARWIPATNPTRQTRATSYRARQRPIGRNVTTHALGFVRVAVSRRFSAGTSFYASDEDGYTIV